MELLRVELAQLQFENALRQAEVRVTNARTRLGILLGRTKAKPPFDVEDQLRRDAGIQSVE